MYGGYPPAPYPPAPMPPLAATATPPPSCNPEWLCTCPAQATSVKTEYGDYTPCIQKNEHQAACFRGTGQWNAWNLGSIEMEPTIQVWGACAADTTQTMQLACNQAPLMAKCSKTGAGWFAAH